MTEILTAAQMRALENAAIESGKVTGLELMERAGRGVVEAVLEEWPELSEGIHRAVVLCGPGNNGGDGFVVARVLKERGWEVEVFLYGGSEKLPPDARVNYERWRELGGVEDISEWSLDLPDLVVDALFGTGLARPIEGLTDPFRHLNEETVRAKYFRFANLRLTSVDLPSGICSDSGKILAPDEWTTDAHWWQPTALRSQLTVTFHQLKLGHVLADGASHCGKVVVKSIGLEGDDWLQETGAREGVRLATAPSRLLEKQERTHKYSHGHALILSGPAGKGGAARLAARGALRIGAGLVTLGCPPDALTENAAQLNAVMLEPVADADVLSELFKDIRKNAICVGPGFGVLQREAEIIEAILRVERPTVIDADALSLIARVPRLFGMLHDACVLTPHAGEFARLFPDISKELAKPATSGPAYSKVDATRAAAKQARCVVLFKGPDTVIAAPDGSCAINAATGAHAAPWLATAGSGDVLAGFITGLLARGFDPMQAAESAAWLHAECARSFGPGLIAEDLPEELPRVLRALGL